RRGGHRAVLAERRLERRDLREIDGERRFIAVDDDLALAALHRHRDDLGRERAALDGLDRALRRRGRKRILVRAREAIFLRGVLGERTHHLAVERALQTVVEHVVEYFAVAHAHAAAKYSTTCSTT